MSLFEERLADLPLLIEGYALERLSATSRRPSRASRRSSACTAAARRASARTSPTTRADHEILQAAGPVLPLAGEWTLGSFCDHVEALDLWPAPPQREPSRLYRVWAYESTALDLALRQAGTSLHAAVGREPRPLRFVVSLRLGEPPTLDPVSSAWSATRRCASSSTRPPSGRPSSSRSSWPPARSTRSTSRASTSARSSTSPPTPSSTGASSRPSPTPGSRTPS